MRKGKVWFHAMKSYGLINRFSLLEDYTTFTTALREGVDTILGFHKSSEEFSIREHLGNYLPRISPYVVKKLR
jgi:hypothetical protein